MKIGSGETEDVIAGIEKGVLSTQVGCHAVLMVLPVELNNKSDIWVVEVGSAKKPPSRVVQFDLKLCRRKTRTHELHPEPSLHRRLRTRVGETYRSPESPYSFGAPLLSM